MISAILRLKNERAHLEMCLKSIEPIFDEIILCVQGQQQDDTIDICKSFVQFNSDKYRYFSYALDSRPNGPGHSNQAYDEYSRAYFYNWCFSKARLPWVCKWDGDMIAMNNCKSMFNKAISKDVALKFRGINVAGDFLHLSESQPFCASEVRLYKSGQYINGPLSEKLLLEAPRAILEISEPLFNHTKCLKEDFAFTAAWPKDWRQHDHFRQIFDRRNSTKTKHNYTLPEICKKDAGTY